MRIILKNPHNILILEPLGKKYKEKRKLNLATRLSLTTTAGMINCSNP